MDWRPYKAVLFDLDGVLTPTATVHAAAWKRTFDDFLSGRPEPYESFDVDTDYRRYVDGKPRYDGVDSFLRSLGIVLPWGDPVDPPGVITVCGIGNLKNDLFVEILDTEGVDPYPGSVRLLDHLMELGVELGVVTASANGEAVLRAAGLGARFAARVDGRVVAEKGLRGKPHPDPYLEAARRLEVAPSEAVVVEDAISGVAAGRAGGFTLVVGVDRHHDPGPLLNNGADIVVSDLDDLVP